MRASSIRSSRAGSEGNAPGSIGVFTLETINKERVMFIPVDVPGAMRRNLIGAFADDPTIPYSPSWSRRFAGAVRSVGRRPNADTSSPGVATAPDVC